MLPTVRLLVSKSMRRGVKTVSYIQNSIPHSTSIINSFNLEAVNEGDKKERLITEFGLDISNTSIFEDIEDDALLDKTLELFSEVNPMTNDIDLKSDKYYTKYVPTIIGKDILSTQFSESGTEYFNPEGIISIGEFLEILDTISKDKGYVGEDSLDGVARKDDFFINGYNALVGDASSYFYGLYSRSELMKPLTRVELAYITVVCWSGFSKYGLTSEGVALNWSEPSLFLKHFKDTDGLRLVRKISSTIDTGDGDAKGVLDLDFKSYLSGQSVSEYLSDIKRGNKLIPVPLFMSLVELDHLGVFKFDSKLEPLKEVSRGDISYFVCKLSEKKGGLRYSRG